VADINDFNNRIQAAIATRDVPMQQRTWLALEKRLNIVCVTDGAHVKRL
jgi:hypothetical protein